MTTVEVKTRLSILKFFKNRSAKYESLYYLADLEILLDWAPKDLQTLLFNK